MKPISPARLFSDRAGRFFAVVRKRLLPLAGMAFVLFFLILVARQNSPRYGLRGIYYSNDSWDGEPVSTVTEARIHFRGDALLKRVGGPSPSSAFWEGFLFVPVGGNFRLAATSDDGSWVYVDDSLVITNDGVHPARRIERDVFLSRGNHRLIIRYFDGGGQAYLDFSWKARGALGFLVPGPRLYPQGANLRQYVRDRIFGVVLLLLKAAFLLLAFLFSLLAVKGLRSLYAYAGRLSLDPHAGGPLAAMLDAAQKKALVVAVLVAALFASVLFIAAIAPARGLQGRFYGDDSWTEPPVSRALDEEVRFVVKDDFVRRTKSDENFSAVWEGFVYAPENAVYLFSTSSDDGSWVSVDDRLVVENGGIHPWQYREKRVFLSRGNHKLSIKYFNSGGGASLDFGWAMTGPPGIFRPRLSLYPRPATNGLLIRDTILGDLAFLLKAAFLAAAAFLLLLAARAARPLYEKYRAAERRWISGIGGRLAIARRKTTLVAGIAVGLALLVLGARVLIPDRGLRARYYADPSWSGEPASSGVDSIIRFKKEDLERRTGWEERLSVAWDGYLFAPRTAVYRLSVSPKSDVLIDGVRVLGAGVTVPPAREIKETELSRGLHRLEIKYASGGSGGEGFDFDGREAAPSRGRARALALYPKPVGELRASLAAPLSSFLVVLEIAFLAAAFLLFVFALRGLFPRWEPLAVFLFSLFLIEAAVYEGMVFSRKSTAVTACDSYAYLQGAELMARNGFLRTEYYDPLIPQISRRLAQNPSDQKLTFLLSPHGHYVYDLEKGSVYNVFPPGTSMILYPLVKVGGRSPAFLFLPLLNLAVLATLVALGTKSVDAIFGICLGSLTLFNTHVFENTVLIMSDLPSLTLLALAALFLFHNIRRPRWWRLPAAGACFGFSVVVRYSNLAGALPLVYLLWLGAKSDLRVKEVVKKALSFGAGAALFGIIPLALYTHRLLGTFFRLVYEPLTQSQASGVNFGPGASYYLKTLGATFGVPALGLAAVGFAVCWFRPRFRAVAIVCALGFLSFFLFYSFQSIRNERYLIPAFPFLAALAGFGVRAAMGLFRRSWLASVLIVALCAGYPFLSSKSLFRFGISDEESMSLAVQKRVPTNAVVFCDQLSGSLRLYAGLPGYRFFWTDERTLGETLRFLTDRAVPCYFLPDSSTALDRLSSMMERNALPKDVLELVTHIRGWPLYRLRPGESAGRAAEEASGVTGPAAFSASGRGF